MNRCLKKNVVILSMQEAREKLLVFFNLND